MTTQTIEAMRLVDLYERVMIEDPFAVYADLRKNAPVTRVKSQLTPRGGYLLSRYDDVVLMHSDDRFSTDVVEWSGLAGASRLLPRVFRLLFTQTMVFKDDPDHKRLRRLVTKVFTPKMIQAMTEDIRRTVDELLDAMAAKRDVDLVADFAVPLPLAVISRMLGVGEEDRRNFHHWVNQMSEGSAGGRVALIRTLPAATKRMKLFERLVDRARRDPDDGLISALVRAHEDDDHLSDQELLGMIFLLLLAGHDTTSNLIGSGTLALIDNADQLALLRQRPELIGSAVEELLRYTSPVPCGAARFAREDITISGTTIPRGSAVLGMIISANRDESVFDEPDRLDINREPNRHVAFAHGMHFCLGSHLARLEGTSAIGALVERFDTIELRVPRQSLTWKKSQSLRGLKALPLRVS